MGFTGIAATFRVSADTNVKSAADRRLPSTDVVLAMLKWIERYMMHRKPQRISASAHLITTDAISAAEPLESVVQLPVCWFLFTDLIPLKNCVVMSGGNLNKQMFQSWIRVTHCVLCDRPRWSCWQLLSFSGASVIINRNTFVQI